MATSISDLKKTGPNTKLFLYSLGLLLNRRFIKALRAFGFYPRFGWPFDRSSAVGVWGQGSTSARGVWISRRLQRKLIRCEDGFLRSVRPGRSGDPSLSFVFDDRGLYYDMRSESALSEHLRTSAELSRAEIARAQRAMDVIKALRLSKYNDFPVQSRDLPERFVLVVDQLKGDASLRVNQVGQAHFDQMLADALTENPEAIVLVKRHPEALLGLRVGHFDRTVQSERVFFWDKPTHPWDLLERAEAVYSCGSQLGLEAIFAGHRPKLYAPCFYAGLGLSDDRNSGAEARGDLSQEQLFHACYLAYTRYFDPYKSCETGAVETAYTLSALAKHAQLPDRMSFGRISLWKRSFIKRYFRAARIRFADANIAAGDAAFVWASKATRKERNAADIGLIEDGFIRSVGLGAELVRPFSLCLDRQGIYYDATQRSDLEDKISNAVSLPEVLTDRASAARARILKAGVSKYNLGRGQALPELPKDREVILVPGQVEDDASIQFGTGGISTNAALLAQVRKDFPTSFILYKPHPDVVAGLREGGDQGGFDAADLVVKRADIAEVLDAVDRVATMTSLVGFEALMRETPVTCYGKPFYAGWGLTDDRIVMPERRTARPNLDQLVYACLIDYPYYWDPVTQDPCALETVLDRLETGQTGRKGGPFNRALSKLQGLMIGFGPFWR